MRILASSSYGCVVEATDPLRQAGLQNGGLRSVNICHSLQPSHSILAVCSRGG